MTLPLHKDPHKKRMVEWWLTRAMPDRYGDRSKQRKIIMKMMLAAEKTGDPDAGAVVLYQLAAEIGRDVKRTCGYWSSMGDYCEPALSLHGYAAARAERWDLCWTGARWEFDIKEGLRYDRKWRRRNYF